MRIVTRHPHATPEEDEPCSTPHGARTSSTNRPRTDRHPVAPPHPFDLPDDLVEAVAAALDAETHEPDVSVRFDLLRRTRAALDAWLDGSMSTGDVVRTLCPERPRTGG